MSSSDASRAESPVRVLIRADAGRDLGTGHVMRCLSLADELAPRDAAVTFATDSPSWLVERIRTHGHHVVTMIRPEDTPRPGPSEVWSDAEQRQDAQRAWDAVEGDVELVVVDHYGLAAPWESHFSDHTRLLAIDDLANRDHDVDVVTDQNWYGPGSDARYDDLVRSDTVRLLGPRYAVLQRSYRAVDRPEPVRDPPQRVLVSFGGNDPGGETVKVLRALMDPAFDALRVDVVLGSTTGTDDQLRTLMDRRTNTELHVAVPSLAPLLARADVAIGASGAATWERLATGVPAMVTTVAPHQSGVTAALDADGVTRWLGLVTDTTPDTYRSALSEYLERPISWVPRVVDGFGAARLAESIIASSSSALRRRDLAPEDVGAVAGLRAEHSGIGEARHGLLGGPGAWRREEQWFDSLIAGERRPTVVDATGVPIALALEATDELLVQRCVTDVRLREAIRRLVATDVPPSAAE